MNPEVWAFCCHKLSCETVFLESPSGVCTALSLALCSYQQSFWASQRTMYEAEWGKPDRTELESNHIIYLLFNLKFLKFFEPPFIYKLTPALHG